MNQYEGIIIFKGDLQDKQLEEECAKVEDLIKKHDGKIEKSERWGKKALSYEIKKFRDGFFLYVFFEAMAESIKPLTDVLRLDGNILRAQILKKEK
ncbi:MAG: 30S ribosomal protein S6 [Candidatus Omnitrophica bacterium]|nr:30S ribosomal protein S6 [Candidatus Omnitrophota bacterium]